MSSQAVENIKVFARIRPSKEDKIQKIVDVDNNDINIILSDDKKTFHFDGVFGEDSTQEEIFDGAASRIVQGALQGYNGTIFAYGQTGSGKSYTMIGKSGTFDENSGIIPRGLHNLFELLDKKKEEMPNTFSFNISISFVEIYNEHIYDLFEMSQEKLKIGQDGEGNAMVKGTTEKVVKDLSDAMEEVKRGWDNRTVGETAMNRSSSRSHALLLIKIHTEEVHGTISTTRSAFLNLVDLAGSERVSQSKVEGERFRETTNINKSLLTLKIVIRELSERSKNGFIAFRNSVLTHILKDSLGGNARTAVMINVHPDKMYYSETLSTLQFSSEVRRIENKVIVNEDLKGDSVEGFKAEIKRLQDEIEKMQSANSDELAEKQRSLDAWKEAALKYERQLAVAKRNAINAAIVARNGGDAAATMAGDVWEKSMNEVAESARKISYSNIRSLQLTELRSELDLCHFEKEELQMQLDEEKKSKGELQEKFNRYLAGAMSPMRKSKLDSVSSQEGSTVFASMLGNPLETTFATPSAAKKERRRTRYTPSRERKSNFPSSSTDGNKENRQSSFFRPVLDLEGEDGVDINAPVETENSEEQREMDLEMKVNAQIQIIDEKTQECESLSRLLKKAEEKISEVEEKLTIEVKSSEEEREKRMKLMSELEAAEKTIGETREKLSQLEKHEAALNEDLIAANAQLDRLNSDMALLKSTHVDKMEELEQNLKSNLTDKEKKEVDLKAEIDRLNDEIKSKNLVLTDRETEKKAAEEVLNLISARMVENEKEKCTMTQELESATTKIEELRLAIDDQKKEMEEEREKREKEQNEKIMSLEGEIEEKKKELDEERRKTNDIDMTNSAQVRRLQEEMESLRIAKDEELREKMAEKEKDVEHWKTVSHQFSEKMAELRGQFSNENEKRLEAEACAKRMTEVVRQHSTENEELKENLSTLGSHENKKQKLHMLSRYVEDKRVLQTRVNQLEATLARHGITIPHDDAMMDGEADRSGQRESIVSEDGAAGPPRRTTRAVATSSTTSMAASAASSKTSVRSSRTTTAARK